MINKVNTNTVVSPGSRRRGLLLQLLFHVLGAHEGQAPLEVGQHVAECLRPVVLRVELEFHREELKRYLKLMIRADLSIDA